MSQTISVQSRPAMQGAAWFAEGFQLFRQNPGAWIGASLIYLALSTALHLVPLIGWLGATLLDPILLGGMMLGCAAQSRGENFRVDHLFSAFAGKGTSLMMLGLIYLGLIALATIPAIVVFALMLVSTGVDPSALMEMNQPDQLLALSIILAVLVALLFYVPVLMGYWLAPALLVKHEISAWQAFKLSFRGCLLNILPALIYGLVVLFWAILASIPFLLGWLVLLPVIFATTFAAYQNIFKTENNLV